ncbi:hypothetical protein BKA65DRAFT_495912 [Rhexocercosporidium sp. MPI-PUGE-AT-0058]|nr:hypothetical protein BKA65DRAFT_495912 [Rhexocercosporidium sp. MPI-PUGE-AT-0058]
MAPPGPPDPDNPMRGATSHGGPPQPNSSAPGRAVSSSPSSSVSGSTGTQNASSRATGLVSSPAVSAPTPGRAFSTPNPYAALSTDRSISRVIAPAANRQARTDPPIATVTDAILTTGRSAAQKPASKSFAKKQAVITKTPTAPQVKKPAYVDADMPDASAWKDKAPIPSIAPPNAGPTPEVTSTLKQGRGLTIPTTPRPTVPAAPLAQSVTHASIYRGRLLNDRSRQNFNSATAAKNSERQAANARRAAEIKAEKEAAHKLLFVNFLDGSPRGGDLVSGPVRNLNRPKDCLIVTRTANGPDPSMAQWADNGHYRMKYDLATQSPAIMLAENWEKYGSSPKCVLQPSFFRWVTQEGQTWVFKRSSIAWDDITLDTIAELFASELDMPNMNPDAAQRVYDWAEAVGTSPGLTFFSFELNKRCDLEDEPLISKHFMQDIRTTNRRIAIVRNNVKVEQEMDDFFFKIMDYSVTLKTHWCYRQDFKGGRAAEWVKLASDNKDIGHEPWMQKVPEPGKTGPVEYATHDVLIDFSKKRKQYRDTFSSALMFDAQSSEHSIRIFCGEGKTHSAKVRSVTAECGVTLEFTFNRPTEISQIPRLTPASNVKITIIKDDADAEMSGDNQEPAQPDVFTATVLGQESASCDYLLYFTTLPVKQHFQIGHRLRVEIDVKISRTSLIRHLAAVETVARYVPPSKPDFDLQQVLLGAKDPMTHRLHTAYETATAAQQELIDTSINSRGRGGYNLVQRDAVLHSINSSNRLQIIEGPPGTGKTFVNGALTNAHANCGKNVLACAPTNTAAKQLLRAILEERTYIQRIDTEKCTNVDVVFLPTLGLVKEQLTSNVVLVEGHAQLWWRVVQLMKADAADQSRNLIQRSAADVWVRRHQAMKRGDILPETEMTEFLDAFKANWGRVFTEAKGAMIVVSTANNSHVLVRVKGLKIHTVLVDEAAFGTEPDSMVPINVKPSVERVVLVGDDAQLEPVVIAPEANENSGQLKLSFFSRMKKTGYHLVFMLRLNYRMHPRLAHFPGMATYFWLGSADNTLEDCPAWLAINEFWNSQAAEHLRMARRAPLDSATKVDEQDCRRILFNTRGSRSAPAPGETSIRNFGNINAIISVLDLLVAHDGQHTFDPTDCSILTPYKGQKLELSDHAAARLYRAKDLHADTFDGMQGGENYLIALDFTSANEHNGGFLGFLKEWPRINAALTRAKVAVWIFGNFDAWRSEIQLLEMSAKTKKWALLMMDLLWKGDVVDLYHDPATGIEDRAANFLPILPDDLLTSPDMWTREIEHMPKPETSQNPAKLKVLDKVTPQTDRNCEETLLATLQEMYSVWQKYEDDWQATEAPARAERLRIRQQAAALEEQRRLAKEAEEAAAQSLLPQYHGDEEMQEELEEDARMQIDDGQD